jgi:hypothetical protein
VANKKGEQAPKNLTPQGLQKTKKGNRQSDTGYPPKWAQKKAKVPYINRTPLPVTVLSHYREKGKTYPISNRAIITLPLSFTLLGAYQ